MKHLNKLLISWLCAGLLLLTVIAKHRGIMPDGPEGSIIGLCVGVLFINGICWSEIK